MRENTLFNAIEIKHGTDRIQEAFVICVQYIILLHGGHLVAFQAGGRVG